MLEDHEVLEALRGTDFEIDAQQAISREHRDEEAIRYLRAIAEALEVIVGRPGTLLCSWCKYMGGDHSHDCRRDAWLKSIGIGRKEQDG